jgi:tetratricopeptide (TPR) repeat protein
LTIILRASENVRAAVRARVLWWSGSVALREGRYEDASAHFGESLSIHRELHDDEEAAYDLLALGQASSEVDQAERLFQAAATRFRELDTGWGLPAAIGNLGFIAAERGDYAGARAAFQEGAEAYANLGQPHQVGFFLKELAEVDLLTGASDAAEAKGREALQAAISSGVKPLTVSVLRFLGQVAVAAGNAERGARLLAGAERGLNELAVAMAPETAAKHKEAVAKAKATLTQERFEAAWRAGSELELDELVDYALGPHDAPLVGDPPKLR